MKQLPNGVIRRLRDSIVFAAPEGAPVFHAISNHAALAKEKIIPFSKKWRPTTDGLMNGAFLQVFDNGISFTNRPSRYDIDAGYIDENTPSRLSIMKQPAREIAKKYRDQLNEIGLNISSVIQCGEPDRKIVEGFVKWSPVNPTESANFSLRTRADNLDCALNLTVLAGRVEMGYLKDLNTGVAPSLSIEGMMVTGNFSRNVEGGKDKMQGLLGMAEDISLYFDQILNEIFTKISENE